MDDSTTRTQVENGEFWNHLLKCVKEEFLMGCSCNDSGPAEEDTGMGILKNHAYGLLDCKEPKPGLRLLCIRNP